MKWLQSLKPGFARKKRTQPDRAASSSVDEEETGEIVAPLSDSEGDDFTGRQKRRSVALEPVCSPWPAADRHGQPEACSAVDRFSMDVHVSVERRERVPGRTSVELWQEARRARNSLDAQGTISTDKLTVCKAGTTTIINKTYITIKHLGSGTFGCVMLCFNVYDHRLYAVKLCRKSQFLSTMSRFGQHSRLRRNSHCQVAPGPPPPPPPPPLPGMAMPLGAPALALSSAGPVRTSVTDASALCTPPCTAPAGPGLQPLQQSYSGLAPPAAGASASSGFGGNVAGAPVFPGGVFGFCPRVGGGGLDGGASSTGGAGPGAVAPFTALGSVGSHGGSFSTGGGAGGLMSGGGAVSGGGLSGGGLSGGGASVFAEALLRFQTEELVKEIAILKRLSHPNIVNLVEVIDAPTTDNLLLVMEYVEGGTLEPVPRGKGQWEPVAEAEVWKYVREVLQGLEYLHTNKVVHGDLKPANLLLDPNSRKVKIADFGSSIMAGGDGAQPGLSSRNAPGFSTPAFRSPESLASGYAPSFEMDMWALGVCMYMWLFGRLPFTGSAPFIIYERIRSQDVALPSGAAAVASPGAVDFMMRLLEKDVLQRLDVAAAMSHPWVTRGGGVPLPPVAGGSAPGAVGGRCSVAPLLARGRDGGGGGSDVAGVRQPSRQELEGAIRGEGRIMQLMDVVFEEVHYCDRQLLISAGDVADTIYLISKGEVEILAEANGGGSARRRRPSSGGLRSCGGGGGARSSGGGARSGGGGARSGGCGSVCSSGLRGGGGSVCSGGRGSATTDGGGGTGGGSMDSSGGYGGDNSDDVIMEECSGGGTSGGAGGPPGGGGGGDGGAVCGLIDGLHLDACYDPSDSAVELLDVRVSDPSSSPTAHANMLMLGDILDSRPRPRRRGTLLAVKGPGEALGLPCSAGISGGRRGSGSFAAAAAARGGGGGGDQARWKAEVRARGHVTAFRARIGDLLRLVELHPEMGPVVRGLVVQQDTDMMVAEAMRQLRLFGESHRQGGGARPAGSAGGLTPPPPAVAAMS